MWSALRSAQQGKSMSHKDETLGTGRGTEGFKNRIDEGGQQVYRRAIKAVAPAMTNQLYTISIKSRKPIENINALVGHVVSSVTSPWTCSVSWDWMVDRVKCECFPSIKPSVKHSRAKMTSMAPKSMKTVIKHPMPDFVVGYGSF